MGIGEWGTGKGYMLSYTRSLCFKIRYLRCDKEAGSSKIVPYVEVQSLHSTVLCIRTRPDVVKLFTAADARMRYPNVSRLRYLKQLSKGMLSSVLGVERLALGLDYGPCQAQFHNNRPRALVDEGYREKPSRSEAEE